MQTTYIVNTTPLHCAAHKLAEVGDSVAVDEVIAEIETDKVSMEIISYPCSRWS